MDIFKLLTRSSNIQKCAPASKKSSSHHIPSHGFRGHSQQDSENGDVFSGNEKAQSRGTKRKRSGVEEKYDDGFLGHLDFMRVGAQPPASLEKQTMDNTNGAVLRELGVHDAQTTNTVIHDLCEDERWQTLKKHKLKVTVLGDASELQDSHRERPKKNSTTVAKNTHPQIAPQPLTSFIQLRSKYGISRRLAENLEAQGYAEPSEVQMGSLPLLLGTDDDRGLISRRNKKSETESRADIDLLTVAPTGSGKTLGFVIYILHGLIESRQAQRDTKTKEKSERRVQALIIAPTHELADQIVNEGRKLASGTGIKISGLRKGMRLHPNLVSLREGDTMESVEEDISRGHRNDFLVKTDVVVSTPLLFLHAISAKQSGVSPLPDVRFLILDEADVLLDPLFREQTMGIWTACTNASLRTSLWSATMGSSIESLAQTFILDRRRNLGLTSSSSTSQHYIVRLVVGLKDSAIPNIAHRLVYAASEQGKLLALRQLLHPSGAPAADAPSLQLPFLVFTQTIPRAIALHSELLYDIPVEAGGSSRIAVLHSDLSDTARSKIMAGFRKGEIWILITTDLLSRGVDFRGLNGVVNYDIPNTGASYVHRVGRTGRQGREGGVAVTLYTKEDIPYVKNVANVIAASERAQEKNAITDKDGEGMQKWLLDALPKVSKKTKKEIKRKGVENRRATAEAQAGRGARKMRISTKSGYDRRQENKKKGAVDASRKRFAQEEGGSGQEDEEWEGIDDYLSGRLRI